MGVINIPTLLSIGNNLCNYCIGIKGTYNISDTGFLLTILVK